MPIKSKQFTSQISTERVLKQLAKIDSRIIISPSAEPRILLPGDSADLKEKAEVAVATGSSVVVTLEFSATGGQSSHFVVRRFDGFKRENRKIAVNNVLQLHFKSLKMYPEYHGKEGLYYRRFQCHPFMDFLRFFKYIHFLFATLIFIYYVYFRPFCIDKK